MKHPFVGASAILFLSTTAVFGQSLDLPANPRLQSTPWPASWITYVACNAIPCVGTFHFRKEVVLDEVPERFIVHVSADNHYRLFVNGRTVGHGPVRGNLRRWWSHLWG